MRHQRVFELYVPARWHLFAIRVDFFVSAADERTVLTVATRINVLEFTVACARTVGSVPFARTVIIYATRTITNARPVRRAFRYRNRTNAIARSVTRANTATKVTISERDRID